MVNDMNILQRSQREKEGGEHAKEGGKVLTILQIYYQKTLK